MKINKYFPFAFIYFFLNSAGLPFGLTYMALLGPFFYIWIIRKRKKEVLLPFFAILTPFILIHILVVGVEPGVYFVSLLNIVLVYLFCQAFYTFLKVCDDPEKIFRKILIINFVLCLISIIFYFTSWDGIFWIQQNLTTGVSDFRRLKMFTYEASYYATLFIPIFFFYLLQYIFRLHTLKKGWLLVMIFLPLILSFSIGVIASAILACLFTFIIYFRQLARKRRIVNAVVYSGAVTGVVMSFLVLFFRHNVLFTRIGNIFSGADTSAKGRTAEAFILAKKLLAEKNEYWGIGMGQVKLLGYDIIKSYYLYYKDYVATIPNAMAETLAIFGWVGFSLKLLIEISLFFLTGVWTNYYRLLLFFFMFIYQFTGSFVTNMAEYVIWILAFTRVFGQFDTIVHRKATTASSITLS